MKKVIILIGIAMLTLTSCSVNSSDNIDIDGTDMTYFKDSRTGLCFGAVASRRTMSASTTGLGVTCVPCDKVEHLIK